MAEKILLKDVLFNKAKVERIAKEIHRVYPSFKTKEFIDEAVAKFPELELKARISWIAECLKKYLPGDYQSAVRILIDALPDPNNPDLSDNDFGDFIYASYEEFVAKNGCTKERLQLSLYALYEMTQRFSAEDAIRYFINAFPEETLKELLKWSRDPHYHVRRLCSEGTRPKLPWSQKINLPLTSSIQILNNLFSDKTRFVARSVANHINDISKTDPDLAIDTLVRWKKSKRQSPEEMNYIIRHALRSLVKKGNAKALKLLGISHEANVHVFDFKVPERVRMNTALDFSFSIKSDEDADVIIDYIIYFQNKSGKLNNKKVFKLKKIRLKRGQVAAISKKHALRQFMTTRILYCGQHEIELQINGKPLAKKSFQVE